MKVSKNVRTRSAKTVPSLRALGEPGKGLTEVFPAEIFFKPTVSLDFCEVDSGVVLPVAFVFIIK